MKSHETVPRSIVKTAIYRVLMILITFVTALVLSGELLLSAGIAGVANFTKTFTYYAYERVWGCVGWGRRSAREIEENEQGLHGGRLVPTNR